MTTSAVQPTFCDSDSFNFKCRGRQLVAPNWCNLGGGSVWDVVMQPSPGVQAYTFWKSRTQQNVEPRTAILNTSYHTACMPNIQGSEIARHSHCVALAKQTEPGDDCRLHRGIGTHDQTIQTWKKKNNNKQGGFFNVPLKTSQMVNFFLVREKCKQFYALHFAIIHVH